MNLATLFRTINRLNPTSRGRTFTMSLAYRLGAVPTDGVLTLEPDLHMELHMDDYLERAIYFDAFEFLCTRIVLSHLKPGSIFLDIGANVGYYSLKAYRRVMPGGRVLAFEANPTTLQRFRRNIQLNGADDLEVFDFALSDANDDVTIFCPEDRTHGLASLRPQKWTAYTEHRVAARRLDDVLPSDLPRIDFLKIDVEGAELLVLRGAENAIRRYKPPILLELNQEVAASFGYDSLDAVELLLEYNSDYRIKFARDHSIVALTIQDLKTRRITDGYLFLT